WRSCAVTPIQSREARRAFTDAFCSCDGPAQATIAQQIAVRPGQALVMVRPRGGRGSERRRRPGNVLLDLLLSVPDDLVGLHVHQLEIDLVEDDRFSTLSV